MTGQMRAPCTLTDIDERNVLLPTVSVTVTPPRGDAVCATLQIDPLVIGTDPDCDVVVADARVSRRHCELRLMPGGIVIRDLGSANGTYIGDVQVFHATLPLDATATIGDSRVTLSMEEASSVVPLSRS